MATAEELLNRAKNADDLEGLLFQGLGGTLLALSVGLISGILSLADLVIKPIDAFGEALGDLVASIFGGPARIVDAGIEATVASLLGPFSIGPATYALSIASVLLGLYVVNQYRDEEDTGNLIPGLPTDIPYIGEEEEDED